MTREATCKILEMIDNGILDPKAVVEMCLKYMSEDDVKDMAHANELSLDEDDDSDDIEDALNDFNYVGSHHHY